MTYTCIADRLGVNRGWRKKPLAGARLVTKKKVSGEPYFLSLSNEMST